MGKRIPNDSEGSALMLKFLVCMCVLEDEGRVFTSVQLPIPSISSDLRWYRISNESRYDHAASRAIGGLSIDKQLCVGPQ